MKLCLSLSSSQRISGNSHNFEQQIVAITAYFLKGFIEMMLKYQPNTQLVHQKLGIPLCPTKILVR